MKRVSREFYLSPADDTLSAYLAFVRSATTRVRIADYSFNLPALTDLLILQHGQGLDVALVLDRSQAGVASEKLSLDRLRAAGVPLTIGTSEHHRIMHNKFTVVDGSRVQYGSYNYTVPAADESNFFVIEEDADIAALFSSYWQQMHDWIVANEPQPAANDVP